MDKCVYIFDFPYSFQEEPSYSSLCLDVVEPLLYSPSLSDELFCWNSGKICMSDRFQGLILIGNKQGFFSILLTHEGSHREVYQDFQPSLTASAGGAKGCSDHRFRAPPAYTAQLPTLHQHRANNQYRTVNQI